MEQEAKELTEKLMTDKDVLDLYNELNDKGIKIWVDGGWGVDALLEKQSRPHGDLDIALNQKDVAEVVKLLEEKGYKEIKRDNEWNFALADNNGHEIDLHAFVLDENGHVVDGIQYPDGSLTGVGKIDGQEVQSISPEFMVKFHTGYKIRPSDIADVTALCEKFGIELPEEYKK